ncbi:hypothetical protein SLEP1_g59822 [Rubroshorea leprosula]|uniref:Uncharacterized protein n=1 Tax=Rubroshorea leprosula TaxID=152421 RepID=A0AAV5MTY7_9ROSI|nr:hypothetical protein SLEP1_g59822 [Rubroshorea leprosula]
MKCDVLELLIFKVALGSCPSKLAPRTWQLSTMKKMLAIEDLLNPLLVKVFSMDEYFKSGLTDKDSRLTMYESISQLLKAENLTRLWECMWKEINMDAKQYIKDEGT